MPQVLKRPTVALLNNYDSKDKSSNPNRAAKNLFQNNVISSSI